MADMGTTDDAVAALNRLVDALDRPAFDLDPARRDWSSVAADLDEVSRLARAAVEGVNNVDSRDEQRELGVAGAWNIGRAGAVLVNAGRSEGGAIIRTASELHPDSAALRFGRRDPDGYVRLLYALDLRSGGENKKAQAELERLAQERPDPDLDEILKQVKKAGRPMKSAPPLGSINGFGCNLFGRRDSQEDGSYVSTLWITGLFIPLLPLRAYRVFDHGDGGYSFLARVPLSGWVARFRQVVLALVVVAIGYNVFNATYNSPEARARRAYAAAESSAVGAEPKAAAEIWEQFLADDFARARPDKAREATRRLFAAKAAQVPVPFTLERRNDADKLVQEYLAATWPSTGATLDLVGGLSTWAGQLEQARDQVSLLRLGLRLLPGGGAVDERRARGELLVDIAGRQAETQPLEALELYTMAYDRQDARDASSTLIDALADRWTLLLEERTLAERWLAVAAEHQQTRRSASVSPLPWRKPNSARRLRRGPKCSSRRARKCCAGTSPDTKTTFQLRSI